MARRGGHIYGFARLWEPIYEGVEILETSNVLDGSTDDNSPARS